MFGSARVPVYWQGPLSLSQEKPRLPVVVFSHGLGANRTVYSYTAYEIASHGFFVAAIEHRDESASNTFYLEKTNSGDEKYDKVWLPYKRVQPATTEERELRNKQVHERAKEISKLMDSIELLNAGTLSNILSDFDLTVFKDKIDIDKAAVIGHSFGGATSITSLVKDLRFKAGIPLDVWMYPLGPEVYKANIDTPLLFINSESFQWEANII
uniref:platelet-activating factor acetylhydrolase-like n=1 Tax=Styela clava TaxID=7725 RepID=UPI001939C6CE|nr:platelet-activating factor acetylhydrolase-like [Styela clava]